MTVSRSGLEGRRTRVEAAGSGDPALQGRRGFEEVDEERRGEPAFGWEKEGEEVGGEKVFLDVEEIDGRRQIEIARQNGIAFAAAAVGADGRRGEIGRGGV